MGRTNQVHAEENETEGLGWIEAPWGGGRWDAAAAAAVAGDYAAAEDYYAAAGADAAAEDAFSDVFDDGMVEKGRVVVRGDADVLILDSCSEWDGDADGYGVGDGDGDQYGDGNAVMGWTGGMEMVREEHMLNESPSCVVGEGIADLLLVDCCGDGEDCSEGRGREGSSKGGDCGDWERSGAVSSGRDGCNGEEEEGEVVGLGEGVEQGKGTGMCMDAGTDAGAEAGMGRGMQAGWEERSGTGWYAGIYRDAELEDGNVRTLVARYGQIGTRGEQAATAAAAPAAAAAAASHKALAQRWQSLRIHVPSMSSIAPSSLASPSPSPSPSSRSTAAVAPPPFPHSTSIAASSPLPPSASYPSSPSSSVFLPSPIISPSSHTSYSANFSSPSSAISTSRHRPKSSSLAAAATIASAKAAAAAAARGEAARHEDLSAAPIPNTKTFPQPSSGPFSPDVFSPASSASCRAVVGGRSGFAGAGTSGDGGGGVGGGATAAAVAGGGGAGRSRSSCSQDVAGWEDILSEEPVVPGEIGGVGDVYLGEAGLEEVLSAGNTRRSECNDDSIEITGEKSNTTVVAAAAAAAAFEAAAGGGRGTRGVMPPSPLSLPSLTSISSLSLGNSRGLSWRQGMPSLVLEELEEEEKEQSRDGSAKKAKKGKKHREEKKSKAKEKGKKHIQQESADLTQLKQRMQEGGEGGSLSPVPVLDRRPPLSRTWTAPAERERERGVSSGGKSGAGVGIGKSSGAAGYNSGGDYRGYHGNRGSSLGYGGLEVAVGDDEQQVPYDPLLSPQDSVPLCSSTSISSVSSVSSFDDDFSMTSGAYAGTRAAAAANGKARSGVVGAVAAGGLVEGTEAAAVAGAAAASAAAAAAAAANAGAGVRAPRKSLPATMNILVRDKPEGDVVRTVCAAGKGASMVLEDDGIVRRSPSSSFNSIGVNFCGSGREGEENLGDLAGMVASEAGAAGAAGAAAAAATATLSPVQEGDPSSLSPSSSQPLHSSQPVPVPWFGQELSFALRPAHELGVEAARAAAIEAAAAAAVAAADAASAGGGGEAGDEGEGSIQAARRAELRARLRVDVATESGCVVVTPDQQQQQHNLIGQSEQSQQNLQFQFQQQEQQQLSGERGMAVVLIGSARGEGGADGGSGGTAVGVWPGQVVPCSAGSGSRGSSIGRSVSEGEEGPMYSTHGSINSTSSSSSSVPNGGLGSGKAQQPRSARQSMLEGMFNRQWGKAKH
ncbi:unnamed protein product [Closterium sp. NIES-65]|nr:unnamed protein product [Closterium sp. NIES-65]